MYLMIALFITAMPIAALYAYGYFKIINPVIMHASAGAWAFSAIVFFSTCITQIYPGEVGVVVDMMGMHPGVEEKALPVGMHLLMPWQSVYHFPTFQQNQSWEGNSGFNFQTSEGLSVHADIGISYQVDPTKVNILFQKYRRGLADIAEIFIPNNIRNAINKAASKMKIEELYGERKDEFFGIVLKNVKTELDPIGLIVDTIFIMGELRVPDNVMKSVNNKIEATQKAQQRENELRETEAEAKKVIARAQGEANAKVLTAKGNGDSLLIEAKAKAEANSLLTKSLSNELIKWESVNKWDGQMPKFAGGSNGVMFQLPFDEEAKK